MSRPSTAEIVRHLNEAGKRGEIVGVGPRGIFGHARFALRDGSAEIAEIRLYPAGGPGAMFHRLSGWALIAEGRTIVQWLNGPSNLNAHATAYDRATRWLAMKLERMREREAVASLSHLPRVKGDPLNLDTGRMSR